GADRRRDAAVQTGSDQRQDGDRFHQGNGDGNGDGAERDREAATLTRPTKHHEHTEKDGFSVSSVVSAVWFHRLRAGRAGVPDVGVRPKPSAILLMISSRPAVA